MKVNYYFNGEDIKIEDVKVQKMVLEGSVEFNVEEMIEMHKHIKDIIHMMETKLPCIIRNVASAFKEAQQ